MLDRIQNLHFFNQDDGTWADRGLRWRPRTKVSVGGCGLMALYAGYYMFTGEALNDEAFFQKLLHAAFRDGYYTNRTTSFDAFGPRLSALTGMSLRRLWEGSVRSGGYHDALWDTMKAGLIAGSKLLTAVRKVHGSAFTTGNHIMILDHYNAENDAMFLFDPSMRQQKIDVSGAIPVTENIKDGVYVTRSMMNDCVRPWSIYVMYRVSGQQLMI